MFGNGLAILIDKYDIKIIKGLRMSDINRLTLKYFFVVFILTALMGALSLSVIIGNTKEVYINNQINALAKTKLQIDEQIKVIARDLRSLNQYSAFTQFLDNPSDKQLKQQVLMQWQALMVSGGDYDQIRWLDNNGKERLRINWENATPVVVAENFLQDKSSRYYFKESIGLSQSQIFISPMDLNIENGVIEPGPVPMLRVAQPVFDSNRQKQGVIIINYYAKNILKILNSLNNTANASEHSWLINKQGYWLKAPVSGWEWGFMFDNKTSFAQQHPNIWPQIQNQNSSKIEVADGVWITKAINPLEPFAKYYESLGLKRFALMAKSSGQSANATFTQQKWYGVRFISNEEITQYLLPTYLSSIAFFSGLTVLILLLSRLLAKLNFDAQNKALALVRSQDENSELLQLKENLQQQNQKLEDAQTQLASSLKQNVGVLKAAMDGYVLMDENGLIIDCNKQFSELMHIPHSACSAGEYLASLLDQGQSQLFEQKIKQAKVDKLERFNINRKNLVGKKVFLSFSMFFIQDTNQLCAFVRDITSLKQNEFDLRMAASVFTHSSEGIFLVNSKGIIVNVNKEFENVTGYSKQEITGQPASFLFEKQELTGLYDEIMSCLVKKGHWYGEFWNNRKTGERFLQFMNLAKIEHPYDEQFHYMGMFSDITLERQYHERLQRVAHYDTLTDLPNRLLFNDRLRQAIAHVKRSNIELAVLFIDLDGFKEINDNYGHQIGDQMLVHVAQQMEDLVREEDTIGRIGGDEFVVLLDSLKSKKGAVEVARKLIKTISKPSKVKQSSGSENFCYVSVKASIGIAYFDKEFAADGELLIRQADLAMYQAKQAGKNRFQVFDHLEDTEIKRANEQRNRFKRAIEQDELVLNYQPKVELDSDKIIGFEALVRWQHPDKGLLPPTEFLGCIEGNDLAVKLSEWVIDRVQKQITEWQAHGLSAKVSVNIGATELQMKNFNEWLLLQLNKYPEVDNELIEIEVLETSALADIIHVANLIEDLTNQGINFALDDFGTGFSSLSYLKKLPIETIKIDRSFVNSMNDSKEDESIIENMIGLTKSLGRKVIAEGIETEQQGQKLHLMGCEYGQGYLISYPLPANEVPKFVENWRAPNSWKIENKVSSKTSLENKSSVYH